MKSTFFLKVPLTLLSFFITSLSFGLKPLLEPITGQIASTFGGTIWDCKLSSLTIKNSLSTIGGQNCAELIHFRDVELYEQYDNAFEKYKLNQDAINEMRRIRKETLGEREWNKLMSTETATSDGGLATAIIAQNIKTTCTLISDLLKFNPAAGIVGTAVEKTNISVERIYETIKFGKSLTSIVDEGAEKTAYKELLSKGGPVGQAVKTAWSFSEGVAKMVALPKDRDNLKSEVIRILDMVDNAVAKYQQALDKSTLKLTELNNIKIGIDKYLSEHCKDNDEIDKLLKKELAKQNKQQNSAPSEEKSIVDRGKKVTDNAFYIFLTTTIEIKPQSSQFSNLQSSKTLIIISKPNLHEGNLTDDMQIERNQFIGNIQKHFADNPDIFSELYNKKMEVHFGKPYSAELLKNSTEGYEAIEAYKAYIKETLDGLAQFDFLEL